MLKKTFTVGRREFMAGAAAVGATTLGTAPVAQAFAGTKPYRIDVHHHFNTPELVAKTRERFMVEIGGMPGVSENLKWNAADSLADMDQGGVATAMLSLNAPGPWAPTSAASRTLCRHCNEFGAALTEEHPGRFGHFASLPLPDVEGSLREAVHALDVLKADGFMMLTSYDGGKWLGDPSFEGSKWLGDPSFWPVYEELNRRKAVVFVHPTTPNCCQKMHYETPPSIIEYPFDTARAIFNLIYSGAALRFPDIRFIFSHGGGAILMMLDRLRVPPFIKPEMAERVPQGPEYFLRKYYYDTVAVTNPTAFAAMREALPLTQILFGTDKPYGPPIARSVDTLHRVVQDPQLQRQIERDNALALLPRFA